MSARGELARYLLAAMKEIHRDDPDRVSRIMEHHTEDEVVSILVDEMDAFEGEEGRPPNDDEAAEVARRALTRLVGEGEQP